MTLAGESDTVQIAATYRMQWEEAQQCYVLLYPEGMVKLNFSASEVLKLCDGSSTEDQIVAALASKFPESDLRDDVVEFLSSARDRGWICDG